VCVCMCVSCCCPSRIHPQSELTAASPVTVCPFYFVSVSMRVLVVADFDEKMRVRVRYASKLHILHTPSAKHSDMAVS